MSKISRSWSFIPGEQADGSIVDKNGLIMTADTRIEILRSVESLPASQKDIRGAIAELIREKQDIIIDGSTWSGKTTTVPIIAREETGNKVVVTGPRVLSVIAAANRTSQILLAQTGNPDFTIKYDEIWYRTGAWNSSERTANLSFHTDGTEMMRQLFSWITPWIIIFDEVQEKSIPTDILLYLARYRKDIQIIIMSATLDPQIYQDFLKIRGREIPVVQIPGKIFPIEEHYHKREWFLEKTVELAQAGKHTLLFVSGKAEIKDYSEKLRNKLWVWYEVLELHAELSEKEQFAAMIPPSDPNIIRVIVATNVAESSITIPYLHAVVDTWVHKIWRINSDGISELRIEPVTLANTKQRCWRSGRVQEWEYYRYCDTPIEDLFEYPEADIENSSLEREILLFLKSWRDLRSLISEARRNGNDLFMHKVDMNLLNIWYERLTRIGALNIDGNITDIGKDILHISLDPFHARMIIEWIKRGCAEEMILIAVILSVNGFLSKEGTWKEIKTGTNKKSDFLNYVDLYHIATHKSLSQEIVERLVFLWIDREEMIWYQKSKWEKMLFEMVNLEPLGIKNHKISQIYNKTSLIKKRLNASNITLPKRSHITSKTIISWNYLDAILSSISAGYPFFIFSYNPESKRFEHDDRWGKRSGELFQLANISRVTPSPLQKYIWVPFIIWPNDFWESGKTLEDDDIFFDVALHSQDGDFCILSHISEIQESHIKNALETQNRYSWIFEVKGKKEKQEEQKFFNIKQIREEYLHIREEMGDKFSSEEYLLYLLPLLIMSENLQFKKFLAKKQGQVIHTMKQRLSRFLKNNMEKYLYRISSNIEKTESNFIHDSDIMGDFRQWEQNLQNSQKRETSRGKKISRTEIEEVQRKRELFEARSGYEIALGRLEWGNFDFDFSKKETFLLHKVTESLLSSGNTFNRMKIIYDSEIWMMDQETRSAHSKHIREASNQQSILTHWSTRMRTLNHFISQLQILIQYCEKPTPENYDMIDFQYFKQIFGNHKNKEIIPTRSQLEKYTKGLWAIVIHFHDRECKPKNITKLASAQRFFKWLIELYNAEVASIAKGQIEKRREIDKEKEWNLQTRKELCIFFSYLYEEEYYIQKIEPMINDILRQLLSSNNKNLDDIIFDYIIHIFDGQKMKRNKHTQILHNFYKKVREYEILLRNTQKKLPKWEKDSDLEKEELIELTNFLNIHIQSLLNKKSDILSLS